ncbi:hypothetical protein PROH_01600 [Prochlorothrix hollandica PCC 9006 = CALU 1027]|uniref:Uncharacterized protein n=1 Tax=Prochlorothrix hollandica PCC 9006 = CALU 1027 TaxID=317619 RepID=A0A0M2Q1E0_PROHO|nr:hypothetical protein PROH_01600 [Prochlorothrix hollandica PCC 9006 = CALU 1027]
MFKDLRCLLEQGRPFTVLAQKPGTWADRDKSAGYRPGTRREGRIKKKGWSPWVSSPQNCHPVALDSGAKAVIMDSSDGVGEDGMGWEKMGEVKPNP